MISHLQINHHVTQNAVPHGVAMQRHTQPTSLARQTASPVLFAGAGKSGVVKSRKLLEHLDFTAVGGSPVKQIGVIFSSLIAWRLLAANERRRASVSKRWNELRENLLRDLLGFGFWFLGVPVLQRVYLAQVSRNNPKLKDILIRHEQATAADAKGLRGWLKANNPLNNRYIPSSQQVKDQMHQTLESLQKAGITPQQNAYEETQAAYQSLVKHRNLATAMGLGSTILLLGVGINLVNFWLTKRNVSGNAQLQSQPQNQTQSQPQIASSQQAANPGLSQVSFYSANSLSQSSLSWPGYGLTRTVQNNPFVAPSQFANQRF